MSEARNQLGAVSHELCWFLYLASTLKMEATYSSEISVDYQRITWRYEVTKQRYFSYTVTACFADRVESNYPRWEFIVHRVNESAFWMVA
jgi:hypothetical protein